MIKKTIGDYNELGLKPVTIKAPNNRGKVSLKNVPNPPPPHKPPPAPPKTGGRGPLSVFERILAEGIRNGLAPGKTKQAIDWYRARAGSTGVSPTTLLTTEKYRSYNPGSNNVGIGSMYMYMYNPKHKKTLPYYDIFPCIFIIGFQKDRFTGINLHYLPLPWRAKLMDALYHITTDKNMDAYTRLRISYAILKKAAKFKAFKPCVKQYLFTHLQSGMIAVTAAEWDVALWLPVARFRKQPMGNVWAHSVDEIT